MNHERFGEGFGADCNTVSGVGSGAVGDIVGGAVGGAGNCVGCAVGSAANCDAGSSVGMLKLLVNQDCWCWHAQCLSPVLNHGEVSSPRLRNYSS
jgi:hypothetical protein